MEGIEVEVFPFYSPTTPKDVLNGRANPTFLTELDSIGGGSVQVSISDPKIVDDPTLIASRNVLKTKVNSKVVGAFLINSKKSVLISDGEKSKEVYEIAGPGLKTWFDDAEVRPSKGLKANSKDERSFAFASVEGSWYKAADWKTPVNIFKGGDIGGSPWRYSPSNWPADASNAYWVWSQSSASGAPVGDNFYRLPISVPTARKYAFYVAADNQYAVYIDGELVVQTELDTSSYREAKKIEIDFEAGNHIIGVRVYNAGGPAGFIASLFYYTAVTPPIDHGTFTMSIGTTPSLFKNNHGFASGKKVYFLSTGALPNGMESGKIYYVTNPQTNSFSVSTKLGGPSINTSGTQSGTHTVNSPEVVSVPKLVNYTGMSTAITQAALTKATTAATAAYNTWNSLPAGDSTPPAGTTEAQKTTLRNQAKAKARAWAAYQVTLATKAKAQKDYDAAVAASAAGITWKVNGYPAISPGWSAGEVLLTLLNEAEARGVRFPTYLTPTFTAALDSNGDPWGEPQDWSFGVGESLLSVIGKLEELVCKIWIDPDTLELNMVAERGIDRSIFQYDVDGITVISTPVIFEKGKNLLAASTESRGKIKNSLSIKSAAGWLTSPIQDVSSKDIYGVIEGTLNTGASAQISKTLAAVVFKQRAQEEEGASYDIFPTDKVPFVDFNEGDWVLAPDRQGLLVKRRIMSISVKESDAGTALYAVEFDTIFRDNEDRLNRAVAKMGGGGVGGSSANNTGGEGSFGGPVVVTPPSAAVIQIPLSPLGLTAASEGYWTSTGMAAVSEVMLTWDPVTANTDDTEMIPTYYEVWGRLTSTGEESYQQYALVTEPFADIRPFDPGTDWTFAIRTVNEQGQRSAFSVEAQHIIEGPTAPMEAPDVPTLESNKGLLIIRWNGLLGGMTPPPQFRYIYAMLSTTLGGIYERVGTTLSRDGRSIQVAGLTVGTTYYISLIAVDGIGLTSAASVIASHALTGIDLGSLEQDVADAIAAAQAAGDAAQGTATDAAQAAQIAQTDANSAGVDAANALTQVMNSITSSIDEYFVSNSSTVAPAPGALWSSDTPDWTPGEYVWRRTKNTRLDNSVTYSSPAVITGPDGQVGEDAVLLRVSSSRGTSFKNNAISTVLTATVFKGSLRITDITSLQAEFGMGVYLEWWWRRLDDLAFGVISSADNRLSQAGFALTVSPADVDGQSVFECRLQT